MKSIEVAKRIEKIAEEKGISGAELARRVGTDRSTITRYYKGTRKISMEELPKFAEVLEVDVIELLFGSEIKNISTISEEKIAIPVLGKIACGEPILAKENIESYIYKPVDSLPSGEIFALQAKGDSMEPTIPDGAIVLLRVQPEVENGEIAAVLVNGDEEATLKRIRKENGFIWLVPDNPKHELKQITEDYPARIIGKAISYEKFL
ncbi:SOS-response transcriptional repressor [Lysinibacillus capsici]|uniref:SOS-response transcriptional repressor n=1 Tax=Lysinibacillus capsici TaxID=2115968 RepID=A0A2X1B7V6_9BACI|nr:LexA family transcriptional regulator [Lysinibacillus capsici]SPU37871.1 SOS-response transcriptional repressor [Lysinibacillus capsici]